MMRSSTVILAALLAAVPASLWAQAGRGGAGGRGGAPASARAAAPIDLTGYWVSLIVDEWRFRVTPQKGDIPYLPLNAEARRIANAWDPAKDETDGNACRAYGAVGVMQRPGRLNVSWQDDNTMKIDTDAGTQTRVLHFGAAPAQKGAPSWQGYSEAQWTGGGRGRGGMTAGGNTTGSLKAITTNMLPGYIRKNGVPYGANAVLTEYFNRIVGEQNDVYISLTAMVDDPMYLTGPFVRTYTFKKQADATGWEPTPCWTR